LARCPPHRGTNTHQRNREIAQNHQVDRPGQISPAARRVLYERRPRETEQHGGFNGLAY